MMKIVLNTTNISTWFGLGISLLSNYSWTAPDKSKVTNLDLLFGMTLYIAQHEKAEITLQEENVF